MGKAKRAVSGEGEQPVLFAAELFPDDLALVAEVKAVTSARHTGSTVIRNMARVEAIMGDLIGGMGVRAVCRRHAVSPSSVGQIREILVASGKMETLERKLSRDLGVLAVVGAEATTEMIMAGTLQPQAVPIAMGIAIQRKGELDGARGAEPEAGPVVDRAGLHERIAALRKRVIDV